MPEFESLPILPTPFKSSMNQWLSKSLFYEHWVQLALETRPPRPYFSLDQEIPGLVNAKATFMAFGDPTGYKWAIAYLKSYDHFNHLLRSSWFKEAYESWVAEMKIELKSQAIDIIRAIASGESPQKFQAAKYLAGADWEKVLSARGRPNSAEVKGELQRQAALVADLRSDNERIALKVIPGGKS